MLAYLREQLDLPDGHFDAACRQLARKWVRKTLRWRDGIPLRTSLRLRRRALEVDPRLHAHLLHGLLPGSRRISVQ